LGITKLIDDVTTSSVNTVDTFNAYRSVAGATQAHDLNGNLTDDHGCVTNGTASTGLAESRPKPE
jgi:hypothetical protein